MYKVVRKNDGISRKIADTYSANNLITKDISPNVSLVVNKAKNHFEIEITKYDRIYYVIEGNIKLIFDGQPIELNVGDACFIKTGTEYEIHGTFKTIIVNQPAFGS